MNSQNTHHTAGATWHTTGMKETLNRLNAAAQTAEVITVNYTDKKGKVTTRDVLVDAVIEDKGIVRVYTDGGFRNMTIANIS